MLEEKVEAVSALLKSISHPLRLRILCHLQEGEMTVSDIQAAVKTTHANISQHLSILRNQGIVASRKEANFIYNRIADPRIIMLIEQLRNIYCDND